MANEEKAKEARPPHDGCALLKVRKARHIEPQA
jgi:hypothetical protein